MTDEAWTPDFAHTSMDGRSMPGPAAELGASESNLVWRNELGGLTFKLYPGSNNDSLGERFIKWNPRSSGVDLELEWRHLEWLQGRHSVPIPLHWGEDEDAQWMITSALPGEPAIGDQWRSRADEAIKAIADGLRALHAVPVHDFPSDLIEASWASRHVASIGPRPDLDQAVLVHGDACAPNTLINSSGQWVGHVDIGDLTVGDRWADLAIASMSVGWTFGERHQDTLYRCYGVEPDAERIYYYRELWHRES